MFKCRQVMRIFKKLRNKMDEKDWQNKSSIMFMARTVYGDGIDREMASKIYDRLTKKIQPKGLKWK